MTGTPSRRVTWFSPCKINLHLNILGRRSDGYHELETVFFPVPVGDQLTVEWSGWSSADPADARIQLSCSDPNLPVDAGNLVHRAATALVDAAGARGTVLLHLEKRLPLAAGLGGGSANAACTLLALNSLLDTPLPPETLGRLAAGLGSDVNFFLQDRPALATGRGEQVRPVGPWPLLQSGVLLIYHPGFGVSTAWAYRELARHPGAFSGQPGRAAALVRALDAGRRDAVVEELYNALEIPVLAKYPVLRLYQEFLRAEGAWAALMSGSGSTTFALFEQAALARRAIERFEAAFGSAGWLRAVQLDTGTPLPR